MCPGAATLLSRNKVKEQQKHRFVTPALNFKFTKVIIDT